MMAGLVHDERGTSGPSYLQSVWRDMSRTTEHNGRDLAGTRYRCGAVAPDGFSDTVGRTGSTGHLEQPVRHAVGATPGVRYETISD